MSSEIRGVFNLIFNFDKMKMNIWIKLNSTWRNMNNV